MRAREKQLNDMIAATMKLAQSAEALELNLVSSLYRMCMLELTNLVDDQAPVGRPRERLRASVN